MLYANADRTGHGPEPFADMPAALEDAGLVEVARIDDPILDTIGVFAIGESQRR